MHTGIISFCDRVAFNIKSSETKEDILRELSARFQVHILQKHWHRFDMEAATLLSRSPHFACLRSNGNPYFMYFTRHNDVPIIFFIDKKIQPGYQVPRVIIGRGKWNEELFKGSLLEGEMVKDTHGGWVFLINDVIGFCGEYLWKLTLPERLEYGFTMLEPDFHTPDPWMDMCKFQMKRYAHATQNGIAALLEFKETLPYTSRGIYFWPFSRKFKPKLHNFDDTLIKSVSRKVKDTPDFREAPPAFAASIQNTSPSQSPSIPPPSMLNKLGEGDKVWWLRKTENPDVYEIFAASHMTSQKMGIAHVPTLKVSKFLRNEFKDATVATSIPFSCSFDNKWQKWVPLCRVS